jgi:hypothetical protein
VQFAAHDTSYVGAKPPDACVEQHTWAIGQSALDPQRTTEPPKHAPLASQVPVDVTRVVMQQTSLP